MASKKERKSSKKPPSHFISFSDVVDSTKYSKDASSQGKNRENLTSGQKNIPIYLGSDPEISVASKKLLKKDDTTKLKALNDLNGLLIARGPSCLDDFLPFYAYSFSKLYHENNKAVREKLCNILLTVVRLNKRKLAVHIKDLIGYWWLLINDTSKDVSSVAQQAFEEAIPPNRRVVAVVQYIEFIIDLLVKLLSLSPELKIFENDPQNEDNSDKVERLFISSYFSLSNLVKLICSSQSQTSIDNDSVTQLEFALTKVMNLKNISNSFKSPFSNFRKANFELIYLISTKLPSFFLKPTKPGKNSFALDVYNLFLTAFGSETISFNIDIMLESFLGFFQSNFVQLAKQFQPKIFFRKIFILVEKFPLKTIPFLLPILSVIISSMSVQLPNDMKNEFVKEILLFASRLNDFVENKNSSQLENLNYISDDLKNSISPEILVKLSVDQCIVEILTTIILKQTNDSELIFSFVDLSTLTKDNSSTENSDFPSLKKVFDLIIQSFVIFIHNISKEFHRQFVSSGFQTSDFGLFIYSQSSPKNLESFSTKFSEFINSISNILLQIHRASIFGVRFGTNTWDEFFWKPLSDSLIELFSSEIDSNIFKSPPLTNTENKLYFHIQSLLQILFSLSKNQKFVSSDQSSTDINSLGISHLLNDSLKLLMRIFEGKSNIQSEYLQSTLASLVIDLLQVSFCHLKNPISSVLDTNSIVEVCAKKVLLINSELFSFSEKLSKSSLSLIKANMSVSYKIFDFLCRPNKIVTDGLIANLVHVVFNEAASPLNLFLFFSFSGRFELISNYIIDESDKVESILKQYLTDDDKIMNPGVFLELYCLIVFSKNSPSSLPKSILTTLINKLKASESNKDISFYLILSLICNTNGSTDQSKFIVPDTLLSDQSLNIDKKLTSLFFNRLRKKNLDQSNIGLEDLLFSSFSRPKLKLIKNWDSIADIYFNSVDEKYFIAFAKSIVEQLNFIALNCSIDPHIETSQPEEGGFNVTMGYKKWSRHLCGFYQTLDRTDIITTQLKEQLSSMILINQASFWKLQLENILSTSLYDKSLPSSVKYWKSSWFVQLTYMLNAIIEADLLGGSNQTYSYFKFAVMLNDNSLLILSFFVVSLILKDISFFQNLSSCSTAETQVFWDIKSLIIGQFENQIIRTQKNNLLIEIYLFPSNYLKEFSKFNQDNSSSLSSDLVCISYSLIEYILGTDISTQSSSVNCLRLLTMSLYKELDTGSKAIYSKPILSDERELEFVYSQVEISKKHFQAGQDPYATIWTQDKREIQTEWCRLFFIDKMPADSHLKLSIPAISDGRICSVDDFMSHLQSSFDEIGSTSDASLFKNIQNLSSQCLFSVNFFDIKMEQSQEMINFYSSFLDFFRILLVSYMNKAIINSKDATFESTRTLAEKLLGLLYALLSSSFSLSEKNDRILSFIVGIKLIHILADSNLLTQYSNEGFLLQVLHFLHLRVQYVMAFPAQIPHDILDSLLISLNAFSKCCQCNSLLEISELYLDFYIKRKSSLGESNLAAAEVILERDPNDVVALNQYLGAIREIEHHFLPFAQTLWQLKSFFREGHQKNFYFFRNNEVIEKWETKMVDFALQVLLLSRFCPYSAKILASRMFHFCFLNRSRKSSSHLLQWSRFFTQPNYIQLLQNISYLEDSHSRDYVDFLTHEAPSSNPEFSVYDTLRLAATKLLDVWAVCQFPLNPIPYLKQSDHLEVAISHNVENQLQNISIEHSQDMPSKSNLESIEIEIEDSPDEKGLTDIELNEFNEYNNDLNTFRLTIGNEMLSFLIDKCYLKSELHGQNPINKCFISNKSGENLYSMLSPEAILGDESVSNDDIDTSLLMDSSVEKLLGSDPMGSLSLWLHCLQNIETRSLENWSLRASCGNFLKKSNIFHLMTNFVLRLAGDLKIHENVSGLLQYLEYFDSYLVSAKIRGTGKKKKGSAQNPSTILSPSISPNSCQLGTVGTLKHLAIYALFRTVCVLPALFRMYWSDRCNRTQMQSISKFIEERVRASIIEREIQMISIFNKSKNDPTKQIDPTAEASISIEDFEVKGNAKTGEISAKLVHDEATIEIKLKLPPNYPLKNVEVSSASKLGISESRWRRWILQMTQLLFTQDGSVIDAILLWKKNILKEMEGVEPCPICYSTFHSKDLSLPSLCCPTCHNKFHPSCLYTWFKTSGKTKCVLCQQPFVLNR